MQKVVVDLVKQYAKVCVCSSDTDNASMAKLCEAGKAFLRAQAMQGVSAAQGRPLLMHYSCDGTPITTKHRVKAGAKSGKGFSCHREGK